MTECWIRIGASCRANRVGKSKIELEIEKKDKIKRRKFTYGAAILLFVTGSYIMAEPLLEKVVTSALARQSALQT